MKYCNQCNKEFSGEFLFCPLCGNKFESSSKLVSFDKDDSELILACYDLNKSYLMGKYAVNALEGLI